MATKAKGVFGLPSESDWFDWALSSEEVVAGILVVLLTVLLRVIWLFTTTVYKAAAEYFDRRIERCRIDLGPLPVPPQRRDRLPRDVLIHCLLVRYGADEYLEKLASDQERYEGRLRLEISKAKLTLDRDSCTYSGTIPLKVHRRLGTQFKLFFEVDDERAAARYVEALGTMTETIAEVSTSGYGAKTRVWFLLERYHITDIVAPSSRSGGEGGNRNNYYFPV